MPATRRSSTTRARALASDSDDDTPLIVSSRKVPRSPTKRKRHSPSDIELIEILSSSDEEDQPRKRQAAASPKEQLTQLQQEIRDLKHKCARLEKVEAELEHVRKEDSELRLSSKRSGKVVLDASQLEDHINCEICTTIMWTPYTLSGCGHTFCLNCLVEWFGTTLAQHMAVHPAWRPTNQPPYHLLKQGFGAHPYIAAMIAQQGPQPEYSCPTCRAPVSTRPVEDYSLKALVRILATSVGESSPKKAPVVTKRKGKGKAKAKAIEGPFDGFFGRES
ncbi:hypothetical protein B0H15DRAFT_526990 [Mycena belliarum]|uniref:RING-type domain-containing protein n=1 Tax=Mycena belliarum TaxID=1033014 RepID=A0AAD6TYK8_9AGAR|nr:hypothetical protein B0H15DRAFT_526990 [Mycena belliae]